MYIIGMRCVSPLISFFPSFLMFFCTCLHAAAFDRPSSANAWQYYIQHYMSKFTWITFYLTTFAICATDTEDAERKSALLLQEMADRGWSVTLPKPWEWKADVDELKLENVFEGVGPA